MAFSRHVYVLLCCVCNHDQYAPPPGSFNRAELTTRPPKPKLLKSDIKHIFHELDYEDKYINSKQNFEVRTSCGHNAHLKCWLNETQKQFISKSEPYLKDGNNIDHVKMSFECFKCKVADAYTSCKDLIFLDPSQLKIVQANVVQKECTSYLKTELTQEVNQTLNLLSSIVDIGKKFAIHQQSTSNLVDMLRKSIEPLSESAVEPEPSSSSRPSLTILSHSQNNDGAYLRGRGKAGKIRIAASGEKRTTRKQGQNSRKRRRRNSLFDDEAVESDPEPQTPAAMDDERDASTSGAHGANYQGIENSQIEFNGNPLDVNGESVYDDITPDNSEDEAS